jgi:hypothetical protein
MNRTNTILSAMHTLSFTPPTNKRNALMIAAAIVAASLFPATAGAGGQASGDLQEKLAAVKQSAAENQKKLHQYQWVETVQLKLNGDTKPGSQSKCQYGPDGRVQKTPIGQPPQTPRGSSLKQRIIAKKRGQIRVYMIQVRTLLAMYVPPSSQRMQQALQAGRASLDATAGTGVAQILFDDYALPGDQMTISFNTAEKRITALNVDTYLDDPNDTVTLAVQFASLPDSTNYVQQSVVHATAKKLQVTTTSSNYQMLSAN